MAEADWSELPKELLNLISQHLDLDLISFRSTWRSCSIPNHHHILSFKFPLLQFQQHSILLSLQTQSPPHQTKTTTPNPSSSLVDENSPKLNRQNPILKPIFPGFQSHSFLTCPQLQRLRCRNIQSTLSQ